MAAGGLVGINKPPGISSAALLDRLKDALRQSSLAPALRNEQAAGNKGKWRRKRVAEFKLGHGGTLDPLASGVIVVGINSGTKQLSQFLGGTKEYEAVALLGSATTTYDSEGHWLWRGPTRAVTEACVRDKLKAFSRPDLSQLPPLYSALKMDGKSLYEYARAGERPPRQIEARTVSCEAELVEFERSHGFAQPSTPATAEECATERLIYAESEEPSPPAKKIKVDDAVAAPAAPSGPTGEFDEDACPIVKLKLKVSSGFYVRSLIHDLGKALGCGAHMVRLVRTRQSQFILGHDNVVEWSDIERNEHNWEAQVKRCLGIKEVQQENAEKTNKAETLEPVTEPSEPTDSQASSKPEQAREGTDAKE